MISFDDFQKIDLRTGVVKEAELVEGTDKLLKLMVDLGEPELRQIVAGIAESYHWGDLVGKTIIVVANLESKTFRGVESQGMLLAVDDGQTVLLTTDQETPPGSKIQ